MNTDLAGNQQIIEITYLIASVLFILSLKWMSSPATAQRGVRAGEIVNHRVREFFKLPALVSQSA